MRTATIVGLLAMSLLAGCLGDEPEDLPGPAVAPADGPALFSHNATGCRLGAAVVLRPMADLAPFLPDGFEPGDAGGLLGTPAPVGLGAVVFSAYSCEHGELMDKAFRGAEINIVVADPGIGDTSEVGLHYYPAYWSANDATLKRAAAGLGWHVSNGTFTDFIVELPEIVFEDVDEDGEDQFLFIIDAVAPQPFAGTSRFWQVVDGGTAWVDYTLDTTVLAGVYLLETHSELADDLAGPLVPDLLPETIQGPGLIARDFAWTAQAGFAPTS